MIDIVEAYNNHSSITIRVNRIDNKPQYYRDERCFNYDDEMRDTCEITSSVSVGDKARYICEI